MKKRSIAIIMLTILLMAGSIVPAFAAPTSMQVDFISRMSGKGLCVKLGSYVYYSEKKCIYRMSSSGANPSKLFEMKAPRDLQLHNSYIYFIDEDVSKRTYTLYRFRAGASSPTKFLDDVYDAVIGGDVLYYTNKARDTIYSQNLKTNAKRTMYTKLFTGTTDLNYMQNMLVFTATMNGKTAKSMFFYSPSSDNATYYTGNSRGIVAQGNYLFMPDGANMVRLTFDVSKPTVKTDTVALQNTTQAIIAGSSFFYWDNDTANNAGRIYKRAISGGTPQLVYQYDLKEYPKTYLEPAGDYLWLFAKDAKEGDYFVKRLNK